MAVKASASTPSRGSFKSDHRERPRARAPAGAGRRVRLRALRDGAASRPLRPPTIDAVLTAAVIISMALTPLAPILPQAGCCRRGRSFDGVDAADGLTGKALVIGFGRFGQVASQALLAREIDVSIIDTDTEMIRAAARFGFKIYYGDGTRLDVLRAAGAGQRRGDPRLHRQARSRPTGSSRSSRPSSRSPSCSSAPSTAAIRSGWSAPASTTRSARPSNRR